MKKFFLVCFLCSKAFAEVTGDANSSPVSSARSKRYIFSTNRLPLSPDNENNFYDDFEDKPKKYEAVNSKYYVPSSFDEFIPGKSSEKYTYGPGGIYIPQSSKSKLDYVIEDVKESEKQEISSKIPIPTESAIKGVKVLTEVSAPAPVEMETRPTFLSVMRGIITNPIVVITFAVIPLILIAATLLPSFVDMLGNLNMGPEVTTTIATDFARSLDGRNGSLSVDRVLDVINEYGARSMEDPRCFQRFLCQATKSGIESRSADSWSMHQVIHKLAKSVDDRLWDAMGLKHLFESVQSGNCNLLDCTGTPAYTTGNLPLIEKIGFLGGKFFRTTKVEQ